MGDIGEKIKTVELEPIESPMEIPVEAPVPEEVPA